MHDPNPRPIVLVTGRQRPHEVLLLVLSVLVGAGYSFGAPPPASVAALMPSWLVHVWAGGLLVSGVTGLASLAGGPRLVERRMHLEIGAMLIGAAALMLSTEATIQYAAEAGVLPRAGLAAGFGVAWTGANLWRAIQIRFDLRTLRHGERHE
jgi:hypothetical protein